MLMLIDAANLYFRAFYSSPDTITAPDGRPVNAIRGYLDMTAMLIGQRRPTRHVACLDASWRPDFRVALIPSYKAHRARPDGSEEIPEKLAPQVPLLIEVLVALGLCATGVPGFEADDVMATLATRDSDDVAVVSGDRDMLALASDRVRVLYAGKGISKLADMGPAEVAEKYGIPAEHYADFAVLRGDPSDGLPGVAGVGEKTAAAIVSRFGSIENVVAAVQRGSDGFPAGAANKVLAALDYLAVAPAAVRCRTDLDIETLDDALPTEPANPKRLAELEAELGIGNSIKPVQAAIAGALAAG